MFRDGDLYYTYYDLVSVFSGQGAIVRRYAHTACYVTCTPHLALNQPVVYRKELDVPY